MIAQILAENFTGRRPGTAGFPAGVCWMSRIDGNMVRSAGGLGRADGRTDCDGAHGDRGGNGDERALQRRLNGHLVSPFLAPLASRGLGRNYSRAVPMAEKRHFFRRAREAGRKLAKSREILPRHPRRKASITQKFTELAAGTCWQHPSLVAPDAGSPRRGSTSSSSLR